MTVPALNSNSSDKDTLPHRQVELDAGSVPISNDLFTGKCRAILRGHCGTYDFDGNAGGGGMDILWEFQLQGRFLRPLRGPLYMAMEVPGKEEIKVNFVLRKIVKSVVKFVRSWGYEHVHVSFGGSGELPHLASPLYQTGDRIRVTGGGEEEPELGRPVEEDGESTRRRRRFEPAPAIREWSDRDVLTVSFNHTYFNVKEWKVVGIPVVGSFGVGAFTDKMRLAVYELEGEDGEDDEEGGGMLPRLDLGGGEKGEEEEGEGEVEGMSVMKVRKGKHRKRNYVAWFGLERVEIKGEEEGKRKKRKR